MVPKRSPTTHTEQLGDEASVYEWTRTEVHSLNPTAARIWNMCDGVLTDGQIAETLRRESGMTDAPSLGWASKFRSDVLWPGEWWFRMRYGIDSLPAWLWYRSIGHPAAFAASAARSLVIKGAGTARDPERAQLLSNPSSQ